LVEYWLDSNIFIESKTGAYAFDIAPGFWTLLETRATDGVLAIPTIVYDEIADQRDDQLSDWLKERKSIFAVSADAAVQANFTRVADYVNQTYNTNQAALFLGKADAWLIAYAMAHGGSVVTLETKVVSTSTKAKIPNVCDHFAVSSIDRNELLRALGASFR
jgi:Domain of unknown function (DUF4411)